MIFDKIEHIGRYSFPFVNDIKAFLDRSDLLQLNSPEIEIQGRDLFVRIMRYTPKPAVENKLEAHQIYADVQVILSGREIMQVSPGAVIKPVTEYNREKDYQFFQVDESMTDLLVAARTFVVFFPGEVHRPSCLAAPGDGEVFKLVFKVRM